MTRETVDARTLLPVAGQAELHIQCFELSRPLHGFYRTMTGLACDLSSDVRPVLKKYKIGHPCNLDPGDALLSFPVIFQFLYLGFVCSCYLVTTHAAGDGGNSSHRGSASEGVTILACNLKVAGMDFVAERYGLLKGIRLAVCGEEGAAGQQKGDGQKNLAHVEFSLTAGRRACGVFPFSGPICHVLRSCSYAQALCQ
jgi:hypothetical protein